MADTTGRRELLICWWLSGSVRRFENRTGSGTFWGRRCHETCRQCLPRIYGAAGPAVSLACVRLCTTRTPEGGWEPPERSARGLRTDRPTVLVPHRRAYSIYNITFRHLFLSRTNPPILATYVSLLRSTRRSSRAGLFLDGNQWSTPVFFNTQATLIQITFSVWLLRVSS